jgi:hypothetical protein
MEKKQIKADYDTSQSNIGMLEDNTQNNLQITQQQYLSYYQNLINSNREMIYHPFQSIPFENPNNIVALINT